MGRNHRKSNRKGGQSNNPSASHSAQTNQSVPETRQKDDVEEEQPQPIVVDQKSESTNELNSPAKEEVPSFRSPVNSAKIQFEDIYPEKDEQDIDVDCLVPTKSPLTNGKSESSFSFPDIYVETASPMIPAKDDQSVNDSMTTAIDKLEEILKGAEPDDTGIARTWRDVEEEKDEEISVLTENILTPDRSSERKEGTETSHSSSKPLKTRILEFESFPESSTGSYRDVFEDYLETISDNLIALMAFFKPNQKHEHYEDYLKAKVNLLLWPLTFVLPSIVIEIIRFGIVTYLLLLGSFLLLTWYGVKFAAWVAFSPWRMFRTCVGWICQFFIHFAVGFVNNIRGGNHIPTALNGHVMKH